MYAVPLLLMSAGVKYENHPQCPGMGVFLSAGNQLMGTYSDLQRFRPSSPDYFRWDAHHIVEAQDLDRLGLQDRFPPFARQVCVLLPNTAHSRRLNSVFRRQNPSGLQVTVTDLKHAYREAYWLLGDYSGGGERLIRDELVNVVLAVFRSTGL
jgi:hypothetical protein